MTSSLFEHLKQTDPQDLRWMNNDVDRDRLFQRVDELWGKYEPYCGDRREHFFSEIEHQFYQKTWELCLASALLRCGHKLRQTQSEGPDMCIEGDPPIWIEAISVKAGDLDNRVLTDEERRIEEIPQDEGVLICHAPTEESIILRCTHALREKNKQIAKWRSKPRISQNEPCIVAISLGQIQGADHFTYRAVLPVFIKAFFGIGDLTYRFEPNQASRFEYPIRPSIHKRNGAPVSTSPFLSDDYKAVSGAICTGTSIFTFDRISSDLLFAHNFRAENPIQRDAIRLGDEWYVNDERLVKDSRDVIAFPEDLENL